MKPTSKTIGRPRTKDKPEPINLTLSQPARDYLLAVSRANGISRTQVVEELIKADREAKAKAAKRAKQPK
jgi:hypothetical protein